MKIHSIGSQTNHYVIWFGVYHISEAVLRLEEFGLSFVVIVERNMRELNRYRYVKENRRHCNNSPYYHTYNLTALANTIYR